MSAFKALGGVTVLSGSCFLVAQSWAKRELGEEALDRLVSFYSKAVPMILEYKILEFKLETMPTYVPSLFPAVTADEERSLFEPLHVKWAPVIRAKFFELGGFYYKNGQRGAGNMGGFVPATWQKALAPFMDQIPPRDFETVIKPTIEAELGRPLEDVFSVVEPEPLGCASIGQAHRAILKGTKERVVIKVQDPRAERWFRGDVAALKALCAAFQPQAVPAFDEMERQFASEFDYRLEASNGSKIAANLASHFPNVVVPNVYSELCSKRLLVMQEIYPAVPLTRALEQQAEAAAKRAGFEGTTEEFMAAESARNAPWVAEAAAKGQMATAVDSASFARYIAFQRARQRLYAAFGTAIGWVAPAWLFESSSVAATSDVFVPINSAKLVDDLLAVHGHEVLIDGCFNADPHPGNILYIAPGSMGRDEMLGLIDYGQVKTLPDSFRLQLAKSIYLTRAAIEVDPRSFKSTSAKTAKSSVTYDPEVHARAKASLAKHMTEIGFQSKHMYEDTMYELCCVYFGRNDEAWLYPRNFVQWSDAMQTSDPLGSLAEIEDAVMVVMTGLYLRGLGHALQQPRDLAQAWGPLAERALKEAGRLDEVQAEVSAWSDKGPMK